MRGKMNGERSLGRDSTFSRPVRRSLLSLHPLSYEKAQKRNLHVYRTVARKRSRYTSADLRMAAPS
jgi:hypothetical protein